MGLINTYSLVKSKSLAIAGTAGSTFELHGINVGNTNIITVESDDYEISFTVEGVQITVADGTKRLKIIEQQSIDSGDGSVELVGSSMGASEYTWTVSIYVSNLNETYAAAFSIYMSDYEEEQEA